MNERIYKILVPFIQQDFPINDLDHKNWTMSGEVVIDSYWSGEPAPSGRHMEARILWSDTSLYVRFDAENEGLPVISEMPNLESKTIRLWDRDVCEIFIAPDAREPRRYFEFEIAPTGEWLDLAIDSTFGERITDRDYFSGMQSAARTGNDRSVMAIKIDWRAFGKKPNARDIWLANLFRCVGTEPYRGYLAWNPTETETPNFHVPEKFGELIFMK